MCLRFHDYNVARDTQQGHYHNPGLSSRYLLLGRQEQKSSGSSSRHPSLMMISSPSSTQRSPAEDSLADMKKDTEMTN